MEGGGPKPPIKMHWPYYYFFKCLSYLSYQDPGYLEYLKTNLVVKREPERIFLSSHPPFTSWMVGVAEG